MTGRPPFLGNSNFSTLAKVCSARHPPAHRLNARVPVELSNLLDRLLEKNPEHRPQSAREVVVELRFLEKQRLAEAGGPYSPWSDTIAFNLPEPWAIQPAESEAVEAAPPLPPLEAPPARPEAEATGPPLEPPELVVGERLVADRGRAGLHAGADRPTPARRPRRPPSSRSTRGRRWRSRGR